MTALHRILDSRGDAPAIKAGSGPKSQMARRHQRPRGKRVRTPDGMVYIGRPTIFCNPFSRRVGHARSVALYRLWIERRLGALTLSRLGFSPHEIDALARWRWRLDRHMHRLFGTDVQCWCPVTSRWCHGDILLAYAAQLVEAERMAA